MGRLKFLVVIFVFILGCGGVPSQPGPRMERYLPDAQLITDQQELVVDLKTQCDECGGVCAVCDDFIREYQKLKTMLGVQKPTSNAVRPPPCPCQRVWMISPWALKLTGMPLPIMLDTGDLDDSSKFYTDQEMAEFYGLTLEEFKEKFLGEQPAHKKKGAM